MASPPFSTRALESAGSASQTAVGDSPPKDFTALLPASHRTRADNIVAPSADDVGFLRDELLVPRIDAVKRHLWVVGRPMPPRPLHHQIMLQRELIITEEMDHHLVWAKSRIFIKPMPAYLLDPDFWSTYLLKAGNDNLELQQNARGFLHSYAALIAYPSDFRIAKEKGLLPKEVTWPAWKQLTSEVLANHCYSSVNPRYWYGELRLSRLNKIYQVARGSPLRGYSRVVAHVLIGDLLSDNFAVLASGLAYVAIVLTAMQVGLATEVLQPNAMFQDASFGFTVFSIVAPLIAAVGILFGALIMIVANVVATKSYENRRFAEIGLEPPSRSSAGRNKETPQKVPGSRESAAGNAKV
jgi:hypothetical protein